MLSLYLYVMELNFKNILFGLLVFFLTLLIGLYFIYQNIPGKPVKLNPVIISIPIVQNQTYEEVKQFYPAMKFNHNKISYSIAKDCDDTKRSRMLEAFDILASKIGLIEFYEVLDKADIEITCSEQEKKNEKEYFIAGEGGAREIISTGRYNIITNGTVILHENPHGFIKCNWANVELHELIHVFGFDHSKNPNSLMYPYLENCEQKLDDSIINELKVLYSEDNLADLYFENISVIKKRKYLDFNLTVKNSGSINAQNVKLSVFDEDELIQTFDLKDENGEIKYGAGIIVGIENLKLKHTNPKEIKLIIDNNNFIKEIDEENNIALIKFE